MPTRLVLAALVLLTCVACGGRQQVALVGQVVDEKGAPLGKVEVFTEPDTDVVLTNPNGFFNIRQRINDLGEIEPIAPGVYRVRVRRFGYEEVGLEVKLAEGVNKVESLVMKPETPDIEDTAPDPTADPERTQGDSSTPIIGN